MLLPIETAYAAVILLIMLWAMALLTRRVRIVMSHVDGMRRELRVMSEALEVVNQAMVARAGAAAALEGAATRGVHQPAAASAEAAPRRPTAEIALSDLGTEPPSTQG